MTNPIVQYTRKKLLKLSRQSLMQSLWESLLNKSLVGMNYWGGARFLESGEMSIVKKLLSSKENVVFFDIGANNGEFTKEVSTILLPSAKIYCFEPLPTMYEVLGKTTEGKNNVFRFNIGFGEKEETLKIHFTKDKEELTSLYDNIPDREFTDSADVKIRTVDEFLREHDIPKIDYLKIDVEGHELKVLEGAKQTLAAQKVDYIQFEFGESMIDARVFFRDFWNLLHKDYLVYRILPDDIREIKKYSESLEIFHCVNYLAVNKLVK